MVQMLQSWGLVEEERIVLQRIEIMGAFELGDDHPDERKCAKQGEKAHNGIQKSPLSQSF